MEINATTKIDELLKEYPFLEDFLVKLSPKFKGLRNPIMRKTIGKVATLSKIAGIGGLDPDDFLAALTAEINRQAGSAATPNGSTPEAAAGAISDPEEKQEALKEIIKSLHAGEDMAVLKKRFGELIDGVEASEIAKMEQALMDEGLPAEEIKRLCDVHVEIFKEALEEQDRPEPPMGHPIHTFMKENRASEKIMSETSMLLGRIGHPPRPEAFKENRGALRALVERLSEIDTHYTRKENQLFPMLEAHHFTGPSQVMWSIHDDIRAGLKQAREAIGQSDAERTLTPLKEAIQAIRDMIYKEEHILYPASLDMLSDQEWIRGRASRTGGGFGRGRRGPGP
jgi:DUF438 domain-containing protein